MTAITRKRFDRGDEAAFKCADRHSATAHRTAVDINGARAAIACSAAIFGAGQV